jgi:GTP pyrophosphokinase
LGVAEVNIENLAKEFGYRKVDGLHEALGCGDLPVGRIVNHFTLDHEVDTDELLVVEKKVDISPEPGDAIAVLGLKGLLTMMAKCCNPAPGDEIVGYITRGRGATIHRQDCPNVLRVRDRERLVNVSWGEPLSTYPIPVQMKAYDRDGLMKDVSTLIADAGINMTRVQVEVDQNVATFNLVLEVRDISELSLVLTRLENLPNVIEARRVKPG